MGKIFCLMGKSSSGKDTIFRAIKERLSHLLVPVSTYTTRPMRTGEVDGEEYHFINEMQLKAFDEQKKVIEQRLYHTVNGPWYYATIDDGSINLKSNNYIMIVTLEAYNNLVKYFGQQAVVPIYIEVEDGIRLERALKREKQQQKPNYDELCRRFLADNQDFATEKISGAGITHQYINDDIQCCISEIEKSIRMQIEG